MYFHTPRNGILLQTMKKSFLFVSVNIQEMRVFCYPGVNYTCTIYLHVYMLFDIVFFFHDWTAVVGLGLLIVEVLRSFSRYFLDEWSVRCRDLSLTTQNTHDRHTYIHAAGGIRNHNPSKQTAADSHLRPRDHWGRLWYDKGVVILKVTSSEQKF
jgi:hypothetical protein